MSRTVQENSIDRVGAVTRRIAGRVVRLVATAALPPALAVLLISTLPPMDSGGGFVASALADEGPAAGTGRGHRSAVGNGNADNDENDDHDDGDRNGGGAGHGSGGGAAGPGDDEDDDGDSGDNGGGPDATAGDARGSKGHRGGGARRDQGERGGGETSADPSTGGMTPDELEDRVLAGVPAQGFAAFGATVLSPDQEAAAIAAGWAPPH